LRGDIRDKDLKLLIVILTKEIVEQNENCLLVETIEAKADLSELEIINFLRNFPSNLRVLKIGVVVNEQKTQKARLYESIVYSNGFPVRFFTDREKALSYLES